MINLRQPRSLLKFRQNQWATTAADVAVEAPVSLTVNGQVWLTFLCTPADLEALAVGFLHNEGLIQSAAEVAEVRACESGANVDVWLWRDLERPTMWRRTSGCAGGATAERAAEAGPSLPDGPLLRPEAVGGLMHALHGAQTLYREAGGVHTSALSDGQRLLAVAEDIGRHNTLDKLAGRCLLEGLASRGLIALTTGRISSEMAQKAIRLGAPIVISRTAPSALAVALAEEAGLTLIGYARRDSFNVYTHPGRLTRGDADRALLELPEWTRIDHDQHSLPSP
jgi:FdhD protein